MLQLGGEADLALEAVGAEGEGELGEEELEGDRAVVAEVLGEVDDGHAAAPELALDGVAVGEGVAQGLRHSHEELLGSVACSGTGRVLGDKGN